MTSTPSRFDGKTIIVTGAGSGIGKETATRLAFEGARVIATDVVQDRLDALTTELADYDVVTVTGDIADAGVISSIVEAAGGTIDGLANVAGIMDGFLPPAEVDDDTWDRVFAVNVVGPMRLTRAVLPLMIEAGTGTIVNVGSEASLRASGAGAAYSSSKHAILGFTKSVAFFYGPNGVRTNMVAPGAVLTNIESPFKSAYAGERVGPIMQATMPTPAQASELAAAITWLLSDDSSNVNGAVLPSDGGWSVI